MEADYYSKCAGCGDDIAPGDEIEWDDELGDWCHADCVDTDDDQPATGEDSLWRL